jgi:hypothetical protein
MGATGRVLTFNFSGGSSVVVQVTVHGSGRAPRPATLPRMTLTVPTPSNRQRCGEGKPAGLLCPSPRPVNGYSFKSRKESIPGALAATTNLGSRNQPTTLTTSPRSGPIQASGRRSKAKIAAPVRPPT